MSTKTLEILIKIEEFVMFLFSIYLFSLLDFSWWWFPLLLLTPDVGMIGYIAGTKIGAFTYNLLHHKGIALIVYFIGIFLTNEVVQLIGIIIFAHSAMDRVLGYGLKYSDSFKHTHLGFIGKSNQ